MIAAGSTPVRARPGPARSKTSYTCEVIKVVDGWRLSRRPEVEGLPEAYDLMEEVINDAYSSARAHSLATAPFAPTIFPRSAYGFPWIALFHSLGWVTERRCNRRGTLRTADERQLTLFS
jgi:hypothetical protein